MNKSPNPNSNGASQPQPNDELRQQLWELSYGLLDDEAAVGLRARIKSDPALARLYAEVRLQTDLVAAASRVQDGSLSISAGPDSKIGQATGKSRDRAPWQKADHASRGAAGWTTNWLAVSGTVALLLLLTFGLLRPEIIPPDVAKVDTTFFYTKFTAQPAVEGLPQIVELQTFDVRDQARSEELQVRLVDGEGRETYRKTVNTSDNGRGQFELPGEVVQPGIRLEVVPTAERGDASRAVAAQLKVAEEQRHTLMLLSTPTARPGEKVEFSMVDVTENSKRAILPPTDELMVESSTGEDVVQPMWTADPKSKVINGQWEMPRYAETEGLAVRRSRAGMADAKQKVYLDQPGYSKQQPAYSQQQSETDRAVRKESTLERAIVMQQRAMETRRNEETLRKSASQPAPKSGEVASADVNGVADKPGESGQAAKLGAGKKPVSDLPPADLPAGRGQRPSAGAAPPSPAPAQSAAKTMAPSPPAPSAPTPSPPRPAELEAPEAQPTIAPAGPKAQATNQPAAANGAARSAPSRSLVDANDGRQMKEAKKSLEDSGRDKDPQNAPQATGQLAKQRDPAEIPLPGLVSGQPTAPAEEDSLAFKAKANMLRAARSGRELGLQASAARGLRLNVEGLQADYAPGQKVQLNIRVVDEEDRPVAANVGVRVWNEKEARASTVPLSLTDALAVESSREWSKSAEATFGAAPQESFAQRGSLAAGPATGAGGFAAGFSGGGAPTGGAGPAGGPLPETRKDVAEKQDQEAPLVAKNLPANPAAPAPNTFATPADEPAPPAVADIDGPQASPLPTVEDQLNETAQIDLVEADNRAQVQRDYELALAAARMQSNDHWQTMGRVLIWSSAGLLVVLGLLLIARQPLRTSVLIPAVALCIVCLTVGIAWFVPPEPAGVQLAFSPATPPSAEPVMPTGMENSSNEMRGLYRDTSEETPVPPGEPGGLEGFGGEGKAIEALKRMENASDAKAESASGQGQGGAGAPVPSNRTGGAVSDPFREREGGPASPASVDKPRAEKSVAGSPEVAKGDSPAPFGTFPEKPNARPNSPSIPLPGAPLGSGGGGLGAGREAGASAASDPSGLSVGGEKLAQSRLQEQQGLGNNALARSRSEVDLPAALYWRPLTPVDESGVITIEFTMPAAESEYRLLIDAIGSGRIGSTQELLICREAK